MLHPLTALACVSSVIPSTCHSCKDHQEGGLEEAARESHTCFSFLDFFSFKEGFSLYLNLSIK